MILGKEYKFDSSPFIIRVGNGDGDLSGDGSGSGDDQNNYDQYDPTGPELSKDTFDGMVDQSFKYLADPGENGNDPSSKKRNRGPTRRWRSKPPTRVSTLLMPATSTAANSNPLTSPPQEPRTTTTTPQRTTQTGRQFPMDQQTEASRGKENKVDSSPYIIRESLDDLLRSPSEDPPSTSGPPEPQEPLGKSVFEEEISRSIEVVSSQSSPQTQESEDNGDGHYDDYEIENPQTSPPQEPRTTTTTPQRTTQIGRQSPMDQQRGPSRGREYKFDSSPFIIRESGDHPLRSPFEDSSSTSGPPEPQEPLGKSVFEEEVSRSLEVVSSQSSGTVNQENFQIIPQTQESEDNDEGHYDDYGIDNFGNVDLGWGNVEIKKNHGER